MPKTKAIRAKVQEAEIKEALENGEISRLRYEDYLSLYEELKEKRRY